ncbi:AAA family ATPase [Deltaproteobacteria bacterium TL4]
MIRKLKLVKFTAFEALDINFSPGLNIFVGENGTGKTPILKQFTQPVISPEARKALLKN